MIFIFFGSDILLEKRFFFTCFHPLKMQKSLHYGYMQQSKKKKKKRLLRPT